MKWLLRFFDFYLDASVHVAFAIMALVQISCITLQIPVYDHLIWFLFFGAISCYNFVKFGVEAEKYILVANKYHKSIQFFSLITLILALYHAHFMNFNTFIAIAILVFLTGLYALPLLPKAKNLRSWGGLKIFVVAIVWAGATVILPVLSANQILSWDVWIETVQRFLLVLILLVPFEIRDLDYDSPELKTIPQRFGVENTKKMGLIAVVIFFLLTFFKDDLSNQEIIVKSGLIVMLVIFVGVTKRKQNRYFASFLVESIPIVWWVVLYLLQKYY